MSENRENSKIAQGPEDVRSEYAAIVEYHGSTVARRFTIAGLYVAAIGFIASAVLDKDAVWLARAGGSALAWWLTVCLWILELRSRVLYTNLAQRGIDIEHRRWGLVGNSWYNGLFSRQYKKQPTDEADKKDVPSQPAWDRPKIAWMKEPLTSLGKEGWLVVGNTSSANWVFWTLMRSSEG